MNNSTSYILLVALLIAGVAFALNRRKLTPLAALAGVVVALLLFAAGGFTTVMLMTVFFIIGTAATSHKRALKQQMETEGITDPRDAWQVLANSGIPAILALATLLMPQYQQQFILMIAAAFATASGDTASSELGIIYGRNFYNIITLKKDIRGLDGVISLEGTLLGIAASMVIAAVNAINFGWGWHFAVIMLSGLTGNLTDSLLGAVLERKHRLGNNMVNFLATAAGAVTAWLLA